MKRLLITLAVISALLALGATGAVAQDDAAALYKAKCQVCHGPDGKGTAAGQKLGVKDLHSPEVAKMTDAQLLEITKKGKEKMPGYDKKLTDDQLKGLIKFVRSLK
ncbi:MAG TPA: cytochrome c [Candidatus Angelobacter sp.]|nr:cytochrome c [Candidatus Angelobacter sp.]